MSRPKIIVCTVAYRPLVGGSEIAIEEITRRLAGDFDFWILTARLSRAAPARETGPDGKILRLGFGTRFDKWLLPFFVVWRARSIIRASDRVLVWGMDISQGTMGAFLVSIFFPRVPFIFTVQYGESEEYLNTGRLGLIGFAFRLMLTRADFVTVISSYLFGMVRARGFCGPVALIPNGADGESYHPLQKTHPDGKRLISFSRLAHKNGVDILIRAVGKVRNKIPEIHLDIAGDGPEKEKLEKIIKEENLGSAVRLLGTIPHERLREIAAGSDAMVRLSRSEGMGNAFVEAMAMGIPVIGTSVGGIPDIIQDGVTGILAKPDDVGDAAEKIILLLTDRDLAGRLAENGRTRVMQDFSWDRIARSYADIFRPHAYMQKRVVIAAGLFPPDIGGPATYTALLAETLVHENIAVRVSYFGAVRHLPRLVRHAAYCLRLLFVAHGSDIIFAQDPVSVGLPALIGARVLGSRFVLKIVGDYAWEQEQQRVGNKSPHLPAGYWTPREGLLSRTPIHPPRQATRGILGRCGDKNPEEKSFETPEAFQKQRHGLITEMRRGIQKFVARRADHIIVPSEYLRGIVTGWGVAIEKIAVVYNAVIIPKQGMPREQAREHLGLSGITIISVGRMVPWKGFAVLIEAIADLAKEFPDMRLVIAGSGPEEKKLRGIIIKRGAKGRIRMVGAIAHRALMDYFSASDIFVLNSGYEGLSHTLIEAMAAGLPVVATDIGGNPEVITDGEQGILIPYGNKEKLKDALRALAGDKDMRTAMSAAARARAAAFTQEKMIKETAMILKSV